ncbi:MAG: GntR family transcriptional regulator [Hyphomicrobiaceae bacterium]
MRKHRLTSEENAGPLYARVKAIVLARITAGDWPPGTAIPTEMELARELGVSQGTVRKALDTLSAEQVLVRRQGSGTYVAEHTPAHVMFRFFNIYDDGGTQVLPDSQPTRISIAVAGAAERRRLGLEEAAKVIRITRIRTRAGRAFMDDRIVLPEALFPGLAREPEVPNTLYDLFQKRYGITVAHTEEQVTAVAASARLAERLAVPPGTPLLAIDRITYDLNGQRIEWRLSHAHLDGAHYFARL